MNTTRIDMNTTRVAQMEDMRPQGLGTSTSPIKTALEILEQTKDIKHLNPVEIEAMVLKHEQQIKDIAAHLLELKQLVTPMMEFKQPTKIFGPNLEQTLNASGFYRKKEWVGLTDDEKAYSNTNYLGKSAEAWHGGVDWAEARLKEKNGGND